MRGDGAEVHHLDVPDGGLGLGGVLAEAVGDVAFRPAPLDRDGAHDQVDRVRLPVELATAVALAGQLGLKLEEAEEYFKALETFVRIGDKKIPDKTAVDLERIHQKIKKE